MARKVFLVQFGNNWEDISHYDVSDNILQVSHFGHSAILKVDDPSPTDMGYEGVYGWAISNKAEAYRLKENQRRARFGQRPLDEDSNEIE
jgi:hypothetical protein